MIFKRFPILFVSEKNDITSLNSFYPFKSVGITDLTNSLSYFIIKKKKRKNKN